MFHKARVRAIAEWLMEFSVLFSVFPLLDSLINPQSPAWVPYFGGFIGLISLLGGLYLTQDDDE